MIANHAPRSIDDIPGWFTWTDQRVFEHFLSARAIAANGNLVELGAYMGKSAVLIGQFKKLEETFTVCDLFGAPADDDANFNENLGSYRNLDLESFQRNYLALHDELPDIVQALSSTINKHVAPHSARFVHVDASHLYEHVIVDVHSAMEMLMPGGVVAFDDYRSAHTPGVSAAVWEAVFKLGLKPICLTPSKLYACFEDPEPHRARLGEWLKSFGRLNHEVQRINDLNVTRIWADPPKPEAPVSKPGITEADVKKLLKPLERRIAALEAANEEPEPVPFGRRVRALGGRLRRLASKRS